MRHCYLCLLGLGLLLLPACNTPPPAGDVPPFSLDELQARTFRYFWELADSTYGQIPDRHPTRTFSSVAATGFGLASYPVGVERGYVRRDEAAARTRQTLDALWRLPQGPEPTGVSGYRGFFYHFLTLDQAQRFKQVELSTIDTGLLMAGVLTVQAYFDSNDPVEQDIRALADSLYRRVEWDWAFRENGLLSMGWHPERGFIPHYWSGYNEAMILLIMAMASPTHPIPDTSWQQWTAPYLWAGFQGQGHVNYSPLFVHQYSHLFIDFRGLQDDYMRGRDIDYFENARRATLANRAYCIENPGGYADYGEHTWGLTACDGPRDTVVVRGGDTLHFRTYWARGASAHHVNDDGTLAPTAAGGSVPFAPEVCIPALEHMWNHYGADLVGEYGFRDAFNPTYTWCRGCEDKGWFDTDYLGIDQGPILLQVENHRSGLIWDLMKRSPYIRDGLRKAGFTGGWLES
ncbi:MAG: glucoamylase family protein [Bacteroidia bacterium]